MTVDELISSLEHLSSLGFGSAPVVRDNPATSSMLKIMTCGHFPAYEHKRPRLVVGHEYFARDFIREEDRDGPHKSVVVIS